MTQSIDTLPVEVIRADDDTIVQVNCTICNRVVPFTDDVPNIVWHDCFTPYIENAPAEG
jgi:hypothetical protein